LEIGDRVRVIDKSSEFYGLAVVIKDKRVEPKPSRSIVYKVVTEDGLPPDSFPFPSTTLTAEQLRPIREQKPAECLIAKKDYLLITTVETGEDASVSTRRNRVHVEQFADATIDEIAERIVKQNIHHLTDSRGTLMFHRSPVKYEVVELLRQPDCINATVMCLYEVEKIELEKEARAANERLKARLDKLAEFARSKVKSHHSKDECETTFSCPVCGKKVASKESIDVEA
jgi:hypothetical protein